MSKLCCRMVFIVCDIVCPGLHIIGCKSYIVCDISCDIACDVYIVSLWGSVLLHFAIAFRQLLHCSGFNAVHSTQIKHEPLRLQPQRRLERR
jgi:hypothetical protein